MFYRMESDVISAGGIRDQYDSLYWSEFCGEGFEVSTRVPPGEKMRSLLMEECGPASKPALMIV